MVSSNLRIRVCVLLILSPLPVYYFIKILQHRGYVRNTVGLSEPKTLSMSTFRVQAIHVPVFDYNWTILLAVNEGFRDFFSNWWWHFQRLGINVPIIVVAEDDVVYTKLRAEFRSHCNNSVTVERSSLSSTTKAVRHGTNKYKKLVSARASHVLKHLKEGLNVLYSDIDTVWLKNPFPYFNGTYDMWIEHEYGRAYCTGFMAIKSNNKTVKLVSDWEQTLKTNLQLNQPIFNKILKASNVQFKPLNETIFPPGPTFNKSDTQRRLQVVVMHNTFEYGHWNKRERFKKLNLWFQTL